MPAVALEKAANAFARAIGDDDIAADLGPAEDPGMHRYLVDAHVHVPEFADLLTPGVGRFIEQHFGSHFRVRSVRAHRNRAERPGTSADLPSALWHLDPEVSCDLRYFVYLTDTTARNAALETIDRVHTRRALRSGYVDRGRAYGPARRILRESAVTHEGPAGTALLVDAERAMHRAGTCAPGRHRDIVQFWITPSTTEPQPDWCARLGPDPAFHGGLPGDG